MAERLGFRRVDEEIVVRAAEKQQLDPKVIADAESRKSFLARYFDDLRDVGGIDMYYTYGLLAFPSQAPSEAQLTTSEGRRALIREAIHETAEEGDVVIVSHAASVALAGRDDVLRVLITGSPETRARRLAGGPLDMKDAAKAVADSDAARADYFKRFYKLDRELPTHYDLVVNTDVLSPDQAAGLVVLAATHALSE